VELGRHALMDLFAQVLNEHRRTPPALADIIIEFESGEPRLVAVFSNGHRASVTVRPEDFAAFCDRYSTWNLDHLGLALTNLGHTIYGQMVECRAIPIISAAQDPHDRCRPRGDQFHTTRWLAEWWNSPRSLRERRGPATSERNAYDRGVRLLTENLSPTQRAQYERSGCFDVTGGDTGKRYRITQAYQMNILEFDKQGKRLKVLCFMPKGQLVLGDVMLAQKLALELFESEALAVANTIPARYHMFNYFA
jgi:hypothetical protein